MFLSRILLNPARRDARRVLESPHVLHAAVLAAFPDPSARESGRVLWRLDTGTAADEPRAALYVVSPERPDLTHLAEQAGWPSLPDTVRVRPYDRVLESIRAGQTYRFRLTANPVHSRKLTPGARGKVYGHVTTAQQEQWLLERQERLGFAITGSDAAVDGVPSFAVTRSDTLSFSRRETHVTLRVATYDGLLTVTAPDDFVRTLSHGIGRAKGYGCGLLTIAPAQ